MLKFSLCVAAAAGLMLVSLETETQAWDGDHLAPCHTSTVHYPNGLPVYGSSVVRKSPSNPTCPPSVPCGQDQSICVRAGTPTVTYSEAGVYAFASIFRAATTQAMENVAIRALNATKVTEPCADCDSPVGGGNANVGKPKPSVVVQQK